MAARRIGLRVRVSGKDVINPPLEVGTVRGLVRRPQDDGNDVMAAREQVDALPPALASNAVEGSPLTFALAGVSRFSWLRINRTLPLGSLPYRHGVEQLCLGEFEARRR
ncbi:MAG: hypothetical protein H0X64_02415 [Gemmatimonadaceae bacterium]|nr:hypothetical protein [Gemmatimonadaceae bacterium]